MRPRAIDPQTQSALLKTVDYRVFLKTLIQGVSGGGRGEMAEICRRAGFSSRSYFSELLSGKKGLSRDSLLRLRIALRLPKLWGQYFEYLAWRSEPVLRPKNISIVEIDQKIQVLRKDLSVPSEDKRAEMIVRKTLCNPRMFRVYAALGTETSGANIKEICERTGMVSDLVKKILSELMQVEAVTRHDQRYFAVAQKADALNFKDKANLSELIRTVSLDLQKKRDQVVRAPVNLTVFSAFSIKRSDMMELRERLQEAIFDVLDDFHDDSGEKVGQLFLSLVNEIEGSNQDV